MADLIGRLLSLLQSIPIRERSRFARAHCKAQHAIDVFDSIPPERLSKTILYLSLQPQTRETRLAAAARAGGWVPILAHLQDVKYPANKFFDHHFKADDVFQLILIGWAFPGVLIHVFALKGDDAYILGATKNHSMVLDLYDTCSGMRQLPEGGRHLERKVMALADGLTHRDLRQKYLQKLHGYRLPAHNVLIHDPLTEIKRPPVRVRNGSEIHVVSVGWVDRGDCSVLRISKALCAAGIHMHVYFNSLQTGTDSEISDYYDFQKKSEYFHIEDHQYGDAYWEHLSRYDFGLAVSERFLYGEKIASYTKDYTEGCGSSRVTDYIQMNLGVIVSPGLLFQYFWARRFATVVVPGTRELFRNPRPILEEALRKKEATPPKDLSAITVAGIASRLDKFYSSVALSGSNLALAKTG